MEYITLRIKDENPVEEVLPADRLLRVCEKDMGIEGRESINVRFFGDFADKAFFLNPAYDWKIGKDISGSLILVPLKKEK